ncbi:MAG: hypothetical protein KA792_04460 [Bacteroidales bacterium]|nr:hypothetical protein [Bacteroidales bacterium]
MNTTPPKENQISIFIKRNVKSINLAEIISFMIFASGFLFFLFNINTLKFFIVIGSVLLAIVYFLKSYQIFNAPVGSVDSFFNSAAFYTFINKVACYSFAITSITMLSLVFKTINTYTFTIILIPCYLIIIIFTLISNLKNAQTVFSFSFYLKIVIAFLFLLFAAFRAGTLI